MRLIPFLFSIATTATAQSTYILPIHGSAAGYHNVSTSVATVVNPNTTPVTLRFEAFYPIRPLATSCALPDPVVLAPHQILESVPEACHGTVHALLMVSDQPVEVSHDVLLLFGGEPGPNIGQLIEHIDVAKDWLPADRDVVIPMVRMYSGGQSRGNLFIVNPNDFVLVISVHVERPEAGSAFARDFAVSVEPRSLSRTSLPVIPYFGNAVSPIVITGIHHVTLRANGKFYAGVSAITDAAPAWRAPILLQP